MSVNISALGNLVASDPVDLDIKEARFQFPRKGRYLVRARENFSEAFGTTKAGNLKAEVNPTIVGPTNEGFELRFISISAKPYPTGKDKKGPATSQFAQYLKAFPGHTGMLSGDPQELADAVAATAGQTYYVDLDWKAYNSATGFEVRGMEKFPLDENGEPQAWIEDPNETGEDGKPKRLRANLEVRRYVSAS